MKSRRTRTLVLGTVLTISTMFGLVPGTPSALAADAETVAGLELRFNVELPPLPRGWVFRYSYRTEDGTAVAGEDYRPARGKVVFKERRETISVQTFSNNENEIGSETLKLYLYDLECNYGGSDALWGWHKRYFRDIPPEIILSGAIRTSARRFGE